MNPPPPVTTASTELKARPPRDQRQSGRRYAQGTGRRRGSPGDARRGRDAVRFDGGRGPARRRAWRAPTPRSRRGSTCSRTRCCLRAGIRLSTTPSSLASTRARACVARRMWLSVVTPCRATSSVPSASAATSEPSATGQQRRGVQDDVVDLLQQRADDVAHVGRGQHLTRVRRGRAGGEHVEVRTGALHRLGQLDLVDQHAGQPDRAQQAEHLGDGRAAQVGVDQADGEAGLGQRGRQVDRDRRLALARNGAGDRDDARMFVDVGELQVGAQLPVVLRAHVAGAGTGGDRVPLRLRVLDHHAHRRANWRPWPACPRP